MKVEYFKKNQRVTARNTRNGNSREGKFVGVHGTTKGDYLVIKPDDGKKEFMARPGMVEAVA